MTSSYNQINPHHIQALKQIVGEQNCQTSPLYLNAYSFDSSQSVALPDCIVFPRDELEVQEVIRYANLHHLCITPRGAGSGMSGGSVNGGIILAMQKYFNHILEIDTQNLSVTLEPGVINADLNQALKDYGLFFPPDPASSAFSTLGGNIAENAGGMSAVKYGVSKDYVLSLRTVLGNGEMMQIGHHTIKDVAGYNLLGLMCGSEGSLGVITQITLKLKPRPKISQSILIGFSSLQDLANCSCAILAEGITPCAMEFLDDLILKALNRYYGLYPQGVESILIVKLDGFSLSAISEEIQEIYKICQRFGAILFEPAQDEGQEQKIWFGRKNASQASLSYGVKKLNEDITVPRSKVAEFLDFVREIQEKRGVIIPCFGHIGDGNIHTNVILQDLKELPKGKEIVEELFAYALSLGGTLSGEHGIGMSKADFMPLAFNEMEMEIFRKIKKTFDPNGILNPFKMGL